MNLLNAAFTCVHQPLNSVEPGKSYVLCSKISTSCFLGPLNER